VAKRERVADAWVAGAVEFDAGCDHAMQRIGQRGARRIEDRGVEQPGGARWWRLGRLALPGVEADMVVIAAGRNERGARTHALHHLKAEHAAVEPERAIEGGDLEMDMSDPRTGDDGWVWHVVSPVAFICLGRACGEGS